MQDVLLDVEAQSWRILGLGKFDLISRYSIIDNFAYLVQFFQARAFCLRSFAVVLSIKSKICK